MIEDLNFNNLRHDFAQRARAAGWSSEEVAYYLGQVTQQGVPALQTMVNCIGWEHFKQKLNNIKG